MSFRRPAFDAVLFDLDGTLVATEQFWPQAARQGALRALAELGIQHELPSAAGWMSLVGQRLEDGFAELFPTLSPSQRARLMEGCIEEEHRAIQTRGAAFLPGAAATLQSLHELGLRLGIASNCSQTYLDKITASLGLDRWIPERRCLHSPGVENKSDMVADLLCTFGTRSAVMVGDRQGDRDAAWSNGLPHIHLSRGYAGPDEEVECEAVIDGMDELLPRLNGRNRWLAEIVQRLGLPKRPVLLGVGGGWLAGKSLFARDLVGALQDLGRRAYALELDALLQTALPPSNEGPEAIERWLGCFDVEAFVARILRPWQRAESLDLRALQVGGDAARAAMPEDTVPAGADLVLVGSALAYPQLAGHLDRLLWLEISDALAQRRLRGRFGREGGFSAMQQALECARPYARAFQEIYGAAKGADERIDAENALGPA